MSKEYGYFEAMEEIIKDGSKVFIGGSEHNKQLFYNRTYEEIRIGDKSDKFENCSTPTINYFWINTKWTLVEEKKKYNVRVYNNISDGRLISSENITMTEEEMKRYCNSKIMWEARFPIDKGNNPFLFNTIIEKFTYLNGESPTTRVVCEELIMN